MLKEKKSKQGKENELENKGMHERRIWKGRKQKGEKWGLTHNEDKRKKIN